MDLFILKKKFIRMFKDQGSMMMLFNYINTVEPRKLPDIQNYLIDNLNQCKIHRKHKYEELILYTKFLLKANRITRKELIHEVTQLFLIVSPYHELGRRITAKAMDMLDKK